MDTFNILEKLVKIVTCKPGWTFRLMKEDEALRLVITVPGFDSYNEDKPITVSHFHPVPIATYNEKTWRRWIFEQCIRVENHELSEWFKIDGSRPFPPLHGPGEDPYITHEFRDASDGKTLQDGTMMKGEV